MRPLDGMDQLNGITITVQTPSDMDTDEDDCSSSLRHTSSSGDSTSTCDSLSNARVRLPVRYMTRLGRTYMDPDPNSDYAVDHPGPLSSDIDSREKDLDQALRWIRQEVLLMREQDKALTSQFIGLRSRILQLRCWVEIYGSTSDMSSLDGSYMSLEEGSCTQLSSINSSGGSSLLSPDHELEFRNRTSSMRIVRRPASLSPILAAKRRSKEYT